MKRKLATLSIAMFLAPIALSATSAGASGGDHDSDDDSDDTESSVPSVPGSSTPVPSIPVPSAPGASTPGDRSRDSIRALDRALESLKKSSIPATLKASLAGQLEALRERLKSGQPIAPTEVQSLLEAVRAALSTIVSTPPTGPTSSAPGAPTPIPSVPPTGAPVPTIPSPTTPSGGSRRSEAVKAIEKMIDLVRGSSIDPTMKDQLVATMQSLLDRIASGQVPGSDEIERILKAAERMLKSLRPGVPGSLPGSTRPGDDDGDDSDSDDDSVVTTPGSDDDAVEGGVPERAQPSPEQLRARMLAVIDEALRLLEGRTTDEALEAVSALQAVKTRLEAGEIPSREEFEEARRLAREALGENPADQALVTLAGVIAAVERSDAPADVKQSILAVLEAARQTILSDPSVNPQEVVREALEEVRAIRVQASVRRLIELSNRLESIADEQQNVEAGALIDQAQALLAPADGSIPERDDVHRAKRLLRRAANMLRPVVSTTVPVSVAPSTTVPDTSAPPTTI